MVPTDNGLLEPRTDELPRHENTWRTLKCILQSEGSQSEQAKYWVISIVWHSGKGKTIEQ